MIFIRYENGKGYVRAYPITTLILLANIIMFIVLMFNGGSMNDETLIRFGALTNVGPYASEWWRYVSSLFLHHGFDHLLFNCFALLVFAPPLERLLGSFKYVLLYLLSGLLGNIVSIAQFNHLGEPTYTVGASGAIYGVYGAFLYIAFFQRGMMDEASRKTLYTLLIIGIVYSFVASNINLMAHLGGLIGGFFIYGLLIRIKKPKKIR
ncbi:rhomboid family intramembrane serine protease [Paenibacillus sediminis]|uniref:Membrane associated rhomboid family serine protease n=1 Tax=Paenibacillus sediminis TaxID=664909 RepID=A0ABS4H5E0_9BACL|nr:rhomboid family intramembrane serine protease [Paenibacillus sediminis]MBP1937742.1 membrane associated rhomboid family serine protease [Paenibacillus sediminis]